MYLILQAANRIGVNRIAVLLLLLIDQLSQLLVLLGHHRILEFHKVRANHSSYSLVSRTTLISIINLLVILIAHNTIQIINTQLANLLHISLIHQWHTLLVRQGYTLITNHLLVNQ